MGLMLGLGMKPLLRLGLGCVKVEGYGKIRGLSKYKRAIIQIQVVCPLRIRTGEMSSWGQSR